MQVHNQKQIQQDWCCRILQLVHKIGTRITETLQPYFSSNLHVVNWRPHWSCLVYLPSGAPLTHTPCLMDHISVDILHHSGPALGATTDLLLVATSTLTDTGELLSAGWGGAASRAIGPLHKQGAAAWLLQEAHMCVLLESVLRQ